MISSVLLVSSSFVSASTTDGAVSGYAWSDKIGWVNFGTTYGDVHITDSAITGYAWNENTGRINLSPAKSGVTNNAQGTLSGYAWSEGTGWINFSGVTVNSSGIFAGTAAGDNGVNIYFSCSKCSVTTDWRPQSQRGGGGGGGRVYSQPRPPFGILINSGAKYANNKNVTLSLNGGPDATYRMSISNFPDFPGAVQENYAAVKAWILTGADGPKTIYAKFFTDTGQPSPVVSAGIILDTQAPEIKITSIKEKYATTEEVLISGATEPNSQIIMSINDKYALFNADQTGKWFITLGKMETGNYNIEFYATDLAQNKGLAVSASFLVEKAGVVLAPPLEPILRGLEGLLKPLIPKFFQPAEKFNPTPVVMIPKKCPDVFCAGWLLLPEKPIERFALAPLPQDIQMLAYKFPQIGKTFSEVGVTKITDVQKIQTSKLTLPTLTESVGLAPVSVQPGKFAMPQGIPLAKLSATAKSKIPSDIVFSKIAGGLVDLNVALSINSQGQAEQRIGTISGQPLQLVVRPQGAVKRVRGYIIFKSKRPSPTSFEILQSYLTASLISQGPEALAGVLSGISTVSVEGAKSGAVGAPAGAPTAEQRLVLLEFDYSDSGSGVYTATVPAPQVAGEYEIITQIDYLDSSVPSKEIKMITVVDPEGYVYEKKGDLETRISGAIVSLYWLNPDTKQYELWPAKNYQQENPQATDVTGTYSFLVPNGNYYLKVDAPGYLSYDGKPFQVAEGSGVHVNIELKTKYWFFEIVDWKTALLILVIFMLVYNFYKDRKRDLLGAREKI